MGEYFDAITVYVIVGGMLIALVGLGLRQFAGRQQAVPSWLAASVVGAAIGGGLSFVALHALGYQREPVSDAGGSGDGGGRGGGRGGGGGMGGGMGMMGGGMGMMGGGMGMMGGGGGGGGGGDRTKRNLTGLVWKLDLATRGFRLELDPEQAQKLAARLDEIAVAETMEEGDAESHLEALNALLSDEQKAMLDSFARPFRRRGGRGGGGGGGFGGMPRPDPASVEATSSQQEPPQEEQPPPNPFQDEEPAQNIRDLMERLKTVSPSPQG